MVFSSRMVGLTNQVQFEFLNSFDLCFLEVFCDYFLWFKSFYGTLNKNRLKNKILGSNPLYFLASTVVARF